MTINSRINVKLPEKIKRFWSISSGVIFRISLIIAMLIPKPAIKNKNQILGDIAGNKTNMLPVTKPLIAPEITFV
jgi:hypothetical protein